MRKSAFLLAGGIGATALATPAIVHMSAYANTLTGLIPDLYAGLNVVSRELVGFIPSVARDSTAERAAVGQSVVWPVAPSQTAVDIVPAMTVPEPRDQTIGNKSMSITKSRKVEFGYTGEEQRGLNTGPGYLSVQAQQFAQALRTLVNEIEVDLAVAAAAGASRGYGTGGALFASTLGDSAQLRKVLDDMGAPMQDRSAIINTTAGAAMRTLSNLTKVNEAGTMMTLRDGELLNIHGLSYKESAAIVSHTKGTASGATTNAAGYAEGATSITLASAGTGTIVAGDLISFAGDDTKYVVVTGDADVSGGGTVVIAAPGLAQAIPASATNITVTNSYAANVAFPRSAMQLAMRAPALPQEGDAALDAMMITDPRSGMTFEIRVYAGYRKISMEVSVAWGVKAANDHIAILAGN